MDASLGPGVRVGERYRIVSTIGQGGFGTVYKARDEKKGGRVVALKAIYLWPLSTQEKIDATDTFNREIGLLSRLRHRNLPRIHQHFTDPKHWYAVMDYIEGQTLEDMLQRIPEARLSIYEVMRIGMELCDVLAYLHNQNPPIIFRDVKPANIMLTPWGKIYLIDFGIARRYREGQTHDTGPLGSPGYAAPEQYGKLQTTNRADIYGLGATLQTLLTGQEPFEIRAQGLPQHMKLPWQLQRLLIQMMEPDVAKRPPSLEQVKKELAGIAGFNAGLQKPGVRFTQPALGSLFLMLVGIGLVIFLGFVSSLGMLPGLGLCAVMLGSGVLQVRRAQRLAGGRLSMKAVALIMWRQVMVLRLLWYLVVLSFAGFMIWFHVIPIWIVLNPAIWGAWLGVTVGGFAQFFSWVKFGWLYQQRRQIGQRGQVLGQGQARGMHKLEGQAQQQGQRQVQQVKWR